MVRSPLDIRLSALRAFLGVIRPSYRQVSASAEQIEGVVRGLTISVLLDDTVDSETLEDIREDVAAATTEILADLPGETPLPLDQLDEEVRVLGGPLADLDPIMNGLIYQRWESAQ